MAGEGPKKIPAGRTERTRAWRVSSPRRRRKDLVKAAQHQHIGEQEHAEDALGDTDSRISARPGQNLVPTYISGSFLMFSPSWSTQRRNCLVASEMNFHRQASRRTLLSYTERLPGGDLVMSGEVRRIGRNLHIVLSNDDSEHVLVFTISSPPPPAAVACGAWRSRPRARRSPRPPTETRRRTWSAEMHTTRGGQNFGTRVEAHIQTAFNLCVRVGVFKWDLQAG